MINIMRVQKRNVSYEDVSFDKISNRLKSLCVNPDLEFLDIDTSIIAQKICGEIYDGVKTTELDILSSETAISLYSQDIKYKQLASRIIISNHHKNTEEKFSNVINELYNFEDSNNNNMPLYCTCRACCIEICNAAENIQFVNGIFSRTIKVKEVETMANGKESKGSFKNIIKF